MLVKVLGTQSPYSKGNHHCPGFLVKDGESKILLDCGSGVHNNMNFPDSLDGLSIILTHLHRDHYNDVFIFQYASHVFRKLGRIKRPLYIYLPAWPLAISRDIRSEMNAFAEYHELREDIKLYIDNLAKDKIATFAQNADLLICESSLLESYGYPEINTHLTAKQAGIIALEAGVKKLALTHFWPEEDVNNYVREASTVFGNTIALYEGRILTI